MATLVGLLGASDNLDETQPVLNRQDAIIGLSLSFLVLTWLCVLFRFYTRFFIMKSPWWDDLFVLLSVISGTIGCSAITAMTDTGMGEHFVLLTPAEMAAYLRLFWLANATYPCSTAFIKLALLIQFLRIYERGTRLWLATVLLVVFTALWGVAYGFLAWVPTVPVDAYWNLTKPAARYAYGSLEVEAFVATYETHAAINMLLDAVVLGVAVPMFFRPGVRKNSFWGLLSLFILGGVVNMMSIWRLQSIVETRATTLPTFDPTWYGPTPIVLSSIEVSLATICASLPVFWPVIKKNLGPYIMVTHEVKITRESRYGPGTSSRPRLHDGDDDDDVELRHQTSELGGGGSSVGGAAGAGDFEGSSVTRLKGAGSGEEVSQHASNQESTTSYDKRDHYRDSFTKHQVLGPVSQEANLGRVTSVRVRCDPKTNKRKELEILL